VKVLSDFSREKSALANGGNRVGECIARRAPYLRVNVNVRKVHPKAKVACILCWCI